MVYIRRLEVTVRAAEDSYAPRGHFR